LFGLGNLLRLAEHFTARSLVEASGDAGAAESFENTGRSEPVMLLVYSGRSKLTRA
jgi:hypothetical protein